MLFERSKLIILPFEIKKYQRAWISEYFVEACGKLNGLSLENEPDWSISQLSSSIALALNLLKISIMFGSDISSKDFDRDNPSKFDISIFPSPNLQISC